MNKGNNLFQNISFLTFFIILLFCVLEVITRVYFGYFAGENRYLQYASLRQLRKRCPTYKYSPHTYLGHYPTPNYKKGMNRHNTLGYRGDEIILPKPDGEFRIVCLGGSTTYTVSIGDYRLSYPALLEKELTDNGYNNVTVINAGCGYWNSWESLINFQFRVLDLEPDMIIIYHGINDVHPRFVWPPEFYRGDNSGARVSAISHVFMPSIFEYSFLIRVLGIRMGLIEPHAALKRNLVIHPETYYADLFSFQKSKKIYPKGIFRKISGRQMLMINKPIYFKRNIESIVGLAKQRNIKVILATFAYSSQFENYPRVSSKEYISALDETNSILRTIAKEEEVSLFDFTHLFPKDKQYYADGRHVTEKGASLKAKLFTQYIIDNHLILK